MRPFTLDHVLIGLELTEADNNLLAYFEKLTRYFSWDNLTLLHVIPQYQLALPDREVYPYVPVKPDEKRRMEAAEKLDKIVDKSLNINRFESVDYFIRSGSPLYELSELANEKDIDFVLVGKKAGTDNHVILAKNLLRYTNASVWMVPEKAPSLINNILVPIDFSENSIRALSTALQIRETVDSPVTIKAINIYQRPVLMSYMLNLTPEQFEREIASNHKEGFDKFLTENFPEYKNDIIPIPIQVDKPDIAKEILKAADSLETDLIVTGARGQSMLRLLLLGSTTENLLNLNSKFPTLVVK